MGKRRQSGRRPKKPIVADRKPLAPSLTRWALLLAPVVLAAIPFAYGKYLEFQTDDPFDGSLNIYLAQSLLNGEKIGEEVVPSARPATLLVNVSNDYWLGGPAGSAQHFAAAVLRAVELGRPLVRSADSGITGAVDAHGRVIAVLASGVPAATTVEIRPTTEVTIFARIGSAVSWLAVAGALMFWAHDHAAASTRFRTS